MPLDAMVTAVVETAINQLVRQDRDSQQRLHRLRGKIIRVKLNEISKQLVFVFSQQVDVLAQFEGEADCELAVSLAALPELRDKANLTRLIKEDKLVLDGDIELAQQFSGLLGGLKPDVAEMLSRYTGDVVAHSVVTGARHGVETLKSLASRQQRWAAEVVTEEWRLAPGPLEVAHFADQVDDVVSHLSRLEARFGKLADKVSAK